MRAGRPAGKAERDKFRIRPAFLFLLLAPGLFAADVNPQTYLDEVKFLASPEMKGRATGSPELDKAADYIAAKFKSFGLEPAGGKSFELAFPVTMGARLGANNYLRWGGQEEAVQPFRFSSSGTAAAEVVFAGYGITNNQTHYDDYSGIDVKGKIVLILRHEPKESKELSENATFAFKASNAKMHGAKAVILINDTAAHPGSADDFEKFGAAAGPVDAGIIFVQMHAADAEKIVKNLRAAEEAIGRDGKPDSFPTGVAASITTEIQRETKMVHNVAAYLPGQTAEYVVIGAHYDHLGLGDEHSLAPSLIGRIHPGADDNASGTAGVIELARWFSRQPKHRRGILFLAFAGEELGLLGSEWYVNHPALPLHNAVAMINMDMIGRIREGKVYVGGSGTGSTFARLFEEVKAPASLHLEMSEKTGYGSSDHTSFTSKQVPVLFFFSGLHGDYHKPSDTADKIDAPAAAVLLDYIADLTDRLEREAARPKFERVAEPAPSSMSSGGGSGYGPEFGSIPDFNEPPKGVRFADVRDGTPAARAGLQAGDILIEFDGKEIGNLYDFTYALRAHKPGDLVLVKVIRGSQIIEAKVLLTQRR
ncbi:MAG TPA: M20/M25/M40 family metallo-hydrolase [Bryobacteraceae bacterium]|jgi:aminopeptidase YwaD|nr:M20/M25/M40 family metallo-hydrolase [Bryobacteraceae bacterium]